MPDVRSAGGNNGDGPHGRRRAADSAAADMLELARVGTEVGSTSATLQKTRVLGAYFRSLKDNDPGKLSISAIVGPRDLSTCATASSSGLRYIQLAKVRTAFRVGCPF